MDEFAGGYFNYGRNRKIKGPSSAGLKALPGPFKNQLPSLRPVEKGR
jgi:hypothetical protein